MNKPKMQHLGPLGRAFLATMVDEIAHRAVLVAGEMNPFLDPGPSIHGLIKAAVAAGHAGVLSARDNPEWLDPSKPAFNRAQFMECVEREWEAMDKSWREHEAEQARNAERLAATLLAGRKVER